MLTLSSTVRIYLAAEPVDLRRGFDGLAAATRQIIREDPLSGHFFCFVNRRRNRLMLFQSPFTTARMNSSLSKSAAFERSGGFVLSGVTSCAVRRGM